jgi:hypothetical protein
MTKCRAEQIAEAVAALLADAQLDPVLAPEVTYDVDTSLEDAISQAVWIVPRSERRERLTKKSWLHTVLVHVVFQVRVPNRQLATLSPWMARAEAIRDYLGDRTILLYLDGFPVQYVNDSNDPLWVPDALQTASLLTAVASVEYQFERETVFS